MKVAHYTSRKNWDAIRKAGVLLPHSECHVHPTQAGPPVVWLTTSETPEGQGLDPDPTLAKLHDFAANDKRQVVILVDMPRSHAPKFFEWAPRHGGHPGWLDNVRHKLPGSSQWRVSTRPIPRGLWTAAFDIGTGAVLFIAPALRPVGFRSLHRGQR